MRRGAASVAGNRDDLEAAVELDVVLIAVFALYVVGFEHARRFGLFLESAARAAPIGKRLLDLSCLIVGRLRIGERRSAKQRKGASGDYDSFHVGLLCPECLSTRYPVTHPLLRRTTKLTMPHHVRARAPSACARSDQASACAGGSTLASPRPAPRR